MTRLSFAESSAKRFPERPIRNKAAIRALFISPFITRLETLRKVLVAARCAVAQTKTMSKAPEVSDCYGIKDGGLFLEQSLESVQALASEIIVVDTGSTDSSIEIATKAQARVKRFSWKDHFSEARNF